MYRPSTEIVVFPAHDAVEEPLPVRMTTWEADAITWESCYYHGYLPPKHPMPAIPVRTGYQPTGTGGMRGVPYIWLMYGYNRLTTFWKGHDPVLEWYDTDGNRHLRRVVSVRPDYIGG